MESLTLATPESETITNTEYHVAQVLLQRFPAWYVCVGFVGDNGERKTWTVTDQVRAQVFVAALNKANLGAKSLERRCMEQAQIDGVLPAGTITGVPD